MLTEGEAKTTHGGFRFVKGELVQRVEYTPFGKERLVLNSALEELPKYTGQTDDIETDLYYYGSRYYDSVLGRFIQPDSIVPDAYSSQSLNGYAYVVNNPLKYTDPTGHILTVPLGAGESFTFDDLKSAADQVVLGNYSGEVTGLGTVAQVGLGFTGLDLPADIRDITYDIQNLELSSESITRLAVDAAALLPGIGALKYADEAGTVLSSERKLLTAGKVTPNAGGEITSFVTETDKVFYRVYSGDKTIGSFLMEGVPKSKQSAKELFSLPGENQAEFIQEVLVPAGTRLQRSEALPAFGKTGGGTQFELLESIPSSNFGAGAPLQ